MFDHGLMLFAMRGETESRAVWTGPSLIGRLVNGANYASKQV